MIHSSKRWLLLSVVFLAFCESIAQPDPRSKNLRILDESFFKWRRFSFVQNWDTLEKVCDLVKLDDYQDNYLDFYCGAITDTGKSYVLRNPAYHNFSHFQFDQAILHLKGSATSKYNQGRLVFVKKFDDPFMAFPQYQNLLTFLKKTYGNPLTEQFTKYDPDEKDTLRAGKLRSFLTKAYPFDSAEQTEWKGDKYITMRLDYIAGNGLVVLVVDEYASNVLFRSLDNNLYASSQYEERLSAAFRAFDKRNGYKQLTFGMPRGRVGTIVTLKPAHQRHDYEVATEAYSRWYDIAFDACDLTFNKQDKLADVSLFKMDFTEDDYNKLLEDMRNLLGVPTNFKDVSGGSEFSRWAGRRIQLIVLRGQGSSITVDINSPGLDDSSPSDKLY